MLQRRYPKPSSTPSFLSNNDAFSSSEDEDDGFARDAEEQERALSMSHGEASEDSPGIKKQQTDAEIANALNANDATKRKRRLVLTEADLTGSKGLIKIRHNFPSKLRYRQPNFHTGVSNRNVVSKRKRVEQEIQAAATYTSSLMQNYEEFATELMPTEHFTDTLNKIQDLGSKKQVKAYLDIMREEVCKQYIEGIHGKEKTEKLFNELEYGLQTHKKRLSDEATNEMDAQLYDEKQSSVTTGLTNNDGGSLVKSNSTNEKKEVKGSVEKHSATFRNKEKMLQNIRQEADESSEDEEVEATFDDVAGSATPERTMDTESSRLKQSEGVQVPHDTISIKDASIMGDNSNDYVTEIITTDASKENNPEENYLKEVISQEILVLDETQNNIMSCCDGTNNVGSKEEGENNAHQLHIVEIGRTDDSKDEKSNSEGGVLNTQISAISQFSQADSEMQERLTFDSSQNIAETQTLVETQNESTQSTISDDNNNINNYSRDRRDIDGEFEALQGKSHNGKNCQNSTVVEVSKIDSGPEEGLAFDSSQNVTEANTTVLTPNATTLFSQDY